MRLAACAALLLCTAACSLIPDYVRPKLPVAETYPAGPAFTGPGAKPDATLAAADIGWRDFFKDPVLQDVIALTLSNNRDLRVAALNVAAAQAQYRAQHASLFPTIDATGSGDFEREPAAVAGASLGGASALHINAYSLGLGVTSYELDLFGKIRSQTRQALEQYFSTAETRQSTQISLVAQVASTYLTWLADRDALAVSAQTAGSAQKSYDLRILTLQKGSGTALDVAQAESTLRTAEASVEQYTRQAAQDLDELVLLVGAPLAPPLLGRMTAEMGLSAEPDFPPVPAGLPASLLERRPDIRAAEHTLLAANANVGAARAAFFPSITLTGSGGTAAGSLGQLFAAGTASWLFQPQISVPIFDAGTNFANLDYARAQKRIEIADYEKAIQSAFHDVSDALAARGTYTRQLTAQQRLVDADQRYFTLSQMRFDAGVDNYLNVLVAQSSLFSAQVNLVTLHLAERQNLVTLYKALGGGWTDRVVAVNR